MSRIDSPTVTLAIRPADAHDAHAVARLAALDSAPVPTGPLLLGVLDGCPQVAVSLRTGAVVADRFSPTAELVSLVRDRAGTLAAVAHAPARRLRWPRGRPALGRA